MSTTLRARPDESRQKRIPVVPGRWLRPMAIDIAMAEEGRCHMVSLVSATDGEGTTTITVNLARLLEEEFHRRVVVVDANLMAPALHHEYGVPLAPGLADVLRGEASLRESVHVVGGGTFAVLPAGKADPREQGVLLANSQLPGVLDQLKRESFNVCLIDCPAVLGSPETAALARHADTTYCIVRAERTRREVVEKSVTRLRSSGCNLGGIILNRALFHVPRFLYRLL